MLPGPAKSGVVCCKSTRFGLLWEAGAEPEIGLDLVPELCHSPVHIRR